MNRCKATKTCERILIKVIKTQTRSKVDVTGYLLAPLQNRREIADTQAQWAHIGVICYRLPVVELLIHWWLHRRRDDDGLRLDTHIRREYVSLQGLLGTWPKYGGEVVAEGKSDAKDTKV